MTLSSSYLCSQDDDVTNTIYNCYEEWALIPDYSTTLWFFETKTLVLAGCDSPISGPLLSNLATQRGDCVYKERRRRNGNRDK